MLVVLNGYDWIGQALLNSDSVCRFPVVHIETTQCMRQMAVLVENDAPGFEYAGDRYQLRDCQAIYCGHAAQPTHYTSSICQYNADKTYMYSAWSAWLRYWCVRIPRRVGVLPDTLWLGTLLHLPALYKRASAFGFMVPSLQFSTQVPMVLPEQVGSGWYGLDSARPTCIDDFGSISGSKRIAVQYDVGHWLQLLVVGTVVMALRLHDDGCWHRYDLPVFIQRLIVKLVVSYDLAIATVLLRKGHADVYRLYALDWHIPSVFQLYYSQDVLDAVKERLYDD